jgi:hypothetical protein
MTKARIAGVRNTVAVLAREFLHTDDGGGELGQLLKHRRYAQNPSSRNGLLHQDSSQPAELEFRGVALVGVP